MIFGSVSATGIVVSEILPSGIMLFLAFFLANASLDPAEMGCHLFAVINGAVESGSSPSE